MHRASLDNGGGSQPKICEVKPFSLLQIKMNFISCTVVLSCNIPFFPRFKFECCNIASLPYFDNCDWTPYVNDFDEAFSYFVRDDYLLCGVGSEHDNHHE